VAADPSSLPSISAVLPAYNEEALIGSTAQALADVLQGIGADYEVIVVDDGSKDGTRAVIDEIHHSRPTIRCIPHGVNRGYGDALRTGLTAATKHLVFFTDGDGQFVADELVSFLPAIEAGADMVIGYRNPRRDPLLRLFFAQGWRFLVHLLFGYTARDIDCAFKLMKREVWQRIQVHSGGATFSAELLTKARRCGYRIVELPVTHRPRLAGQATGANVHVIVRAFRELAWLRVRLEPCPPLPKD
jgi:glycosyltransferase involved in cell wall biosynthesis